MFSPWYARARRGPQPADPFRHCAVNICLYGARRRWVMTERAADAASPDRRADHWTLGGTSIGWQDGELHVEFDERTSPWNERVRGRVRLRPELGLPAPLALDPAGRHQWWPVAARSHAVVELDQPALRFEGPAYHDANFGQEPLEQGFRRWTWSRATLPEGVAVVYDTEPRGGPPQRLAMVVEPDGPRPLELPAQVALPASGWRVFRETRADGPGQASVVRTLEDTPFYNRSLLRTRLDGHEVLAVHEALDLDRFARPWVQFLLPFKSRRVGA